jgi:hypothetical protein
LQIHNRFSHFCLQSLFYNNCTGKHITLNAPFSALALAV